MKVFAWLEQALATVLWTGFSPISPGTVSSAVTCVILWFVPGALRWPGALLLIPATFAGVWMSTRAIGVLAAPSDPKFKRLRRPDPSAEDPDPVTIDEFIGQWITLLAVPHTVIGFGLAFVAFRAFDVLKPFGIGKLQRFPAGWGIMLDDVGAGIAGLAVVGIADLLMPTIIQSSWPLP